MGVIFGFIWQVQHRGFTVRTPDRFEKAVELLVELDTGQAMALLTLVDFVVDITLVNAIALQEIDLFKTAGARSLIDSTHGGV